MKSKKILWCDDVEVPYTSTHAHSFGDGRLDGEH